MKITKRFRSLSVHTRPKSAKGTLDLRLLFLIYFLAASSVVSNAAMAYQGERSRSADVDRQFLNEVDSLAIRVSHSKGKVAIVFRHRVHENLRRDGTRVPNALGRDALRILDIKTETLHLVASSDDDDMLMVNPVWSDDDSWIGFGTFSEGVHSPTTTGKTWVVRSDGQQLHVITLPPPYSRFSTGLVRWIRNDVFQITGMTFVPENSFNPERYHDFLVNCTTGEITDVGDSNGPNH